jgi:Uma2 family endonuclease
LVELTIPFPERGGAVRLPAGVFQWSENEFFHFCQVNRKLRIERSAKGETIVMSPTGGYSGYRSGEVFGQLRAWAVRNKTGVAFDSSAGFLLPNGAMRSPDAAWVRLTRLRSLTLREKEQFIPLCPDFVIEVASPSDELPALREKMDEYRTSGLLLGWLVLPASTEVEVHTPSGVEVLTSPQAVSADPALPDFKLDLTSIWNPPF